MNSNHSAVAALQCADIKTKGGYQLGRSACACVGKGGGGQNDGGSKEMFFEGIKILLSSVKNVNYGREVSTAVV